MAKSRNIIGEKFGKLTALEVNKLTKILKQKEMGT